MHCIPKDNTLHSDSIVIIQDKMMDSLSILLRFTKVNFKQHFTIFYPSVGVFTQNLWGHMLSSKKGRAL